MVGTKQGSLEYKQISKSKSLLQLLLVLHLILHLAFSFNTLSASDTTKIYYGLQLNNFTTNSN